MERRGHGIDAGFRHLIEAGLKSSFVGYHMDVTSSKVIHMSKKGVAIDIAEAGDEVDIVTEETPFYGGVRRPERRHRNNRRQGRNA